MRMRCGCSGSGEGDEYAELFGLDELISQDFQHGRVYGTVRVRNPFTTE